MQRISKAQLEFLTNEINEITGSPLKPYENVNGSLVGQIGNYHLYGAYGGWGLHRTMNEGGGITEIIGLSTKRELYDRMQSLIYGLSAKAA